MEETIVTVLEGKHLYEKKQFHVGGVQQNTHFNFCGNYGWYG